LDTYLFHPKLRRRIYFRYGVYFYDGTEWRWNICRPANWGNNYDFF